MLLLATSETLSDRQPEWILALEKELIFVDVLIEIYPKALRGSSSTVEWGEFYPSLN